MVYPWKFDYLVNNHWIIIVHHQGFEMKWNFLMKMFVLILRSQMELKYLLFMNSLLAKIIVHGQNRNETIDHDKCIESNSFNWYKFQLKFNSWNNSIFILSKRWNFLKLFKWKIWIWSQCHWMWNIYNNSRLSRSNWILGYRCSSIRSNG